MGLVIDGAMQQAPQRGRHARGVEVEVAAATDPGSALRAGDMRGLSSRVAYRRQRA